MYSAFATLRFLMGMGHVGTFMQSFTLSVEYVGPADKRTLCGCLIEVAFAAGMYQLLSNVFQKQKFSRLCPKEN